MTFPFVGRSAAETSFSRFAQNSALLDFLREAVDEQIRGLSFSFFNQYSHR